MKDRYQKAQFATILGMIANIILTLIKGVGGVLGNSRALVADAFHSASDVISSIAVLIGVRAAQKPPDTEHPYGHGKAENIAALIVAFLLIIIGFEILVDAITVIWTGVDQPEAVSTFTLYIVFFSILIKEVLFQYKNRLGQRIKSPALIADAWHHRSDAISSVVALLGIGLSILGANAGIPYLHYFDPIASAVIGVIIMWMAVNLGKEAVKVSLEIVLDEEEAKKYYKTIDSIEGVKRIDSLHARSHGSYVIIDVKISVDSTITVDEGHDIAVEVRNSLLHNHEDIQDVYVHVNPYYN